MAATSCKKTKALDSFARGSGTSSQHLPQLEFRNFRIRDASRERYVNEPQSDIHLRVTPLSYKPPTKRQRHPAKLAHFATRQERYGYSRDYYTSHTPNHQP